MQGGVNGVKGRVARTIESNLSAEKIYQFYCGQHGGNLIPLYLVQAFRIVDSITQRVGRDGENVLTVVVAVLVNWRQRLREGAVIPLARQSSCLGGTL